MGKIRRLYYQNKDLIWIGIFAIIGAIVIIQSLNNYYKNNPNKRENSSTNSTTIYNKPNYAVVSRKRNIKTKSTKNTRYYFKIF